jgi:hypothetical protein
MKALEIAPFLMMVTEKNCQFTPVSELDSDFNAADSLSLTLKRIAVLKDYLPDGLKFRGADLGIIDEDLLLWFTPDKHPAGRPMEADVMLSLIAGVHYLAEQALDAKKAEILVKLKGVLISS